MNGTRTRRRLTSAFAGTLLAGGLAAQPLEEGSGPLPLADLDLPVSIQAVMISLIDPAAHYLWDYSTRDELGEDQWAAVAHMATQLAAAGPLIRMGGTGEEDQAWVNDRRWILFARDMQNAGLDALAAAGARDQTALSGASSRLVNTCDACHQIFRPSLTPEELHEVPPGGLYRSW